LLACYVLLGADRLSLDRLLSQGLKSSPLPQVGALITLLDTTQRAIATPQPETWRSSSQSEY
jgi:hypothetical protein